MVIDNKFEHGQTVYLVTDTEQLPRIVTEIRVCPGPNLLYQLSTGKDYSDHYDFEISTEENTELKVK